MQSIKLRVASRSLWEDTPLVASRSLWKDTPLHETLSGVLRSVADTLLKQILFVHQKYFDEVDFGIKSTLYQNGLNCMKVQRECQHLARRSSIKDDEQKRISIQKLEKEKKRIHSKVVFRPQPLKYKTIRSECNALLVNFMPFLHELKSNPDLSVIVNIASNWQVTSAAFISRLSEEYAEYIDIIRPVQVAVYGSGPLKLMDIFPKVDMVFGNGQKLTLTPENYLFRVI